MEGSAQGHSTPLAIPPAIYAVVSGIAHTSRNYRWDCWTGRGVYSVLDQLFWLHLWRCGIELPELSHNFAVGNRSLSDASASQKEDRVSVPLLGSQTSHSSRLLIFECFSRFQLLQDQRFVPFGGGTNSSTDQKWGVRLGFQAAAADPATRPLRDASGVGTGTEPMHCGEVPRHLCRSRRSCY